LKWSERFLKDSPLLIRITIKAQLTTMSIQIPNLHTSNKTSARVKARVFIARRKDSVHAGEFTVQGNLSFNPATDDYPKATLSIRVDLSDSAKGTVVIKTVEQLDTTGKHTPTLFASGRCNLDADVKAAAPESRVMVTRAAGHG